MDEETNNQMREKRMTAKESKKGSLRLKRPNRRLQVSRGECQTGPGQVKPQIVRRGAKSDFQGDFAEARQSEAPEMRNGGRKGSIATAGSWGYFLRHELRLQPVL
jgi:hypothetical protein